MRVGIMVVYILGDVGKETAAYLVSLAVKNDEVDSHVVFQQKLADRIRRRAQRLLLGIAESAGGYQRKSDGLAAVLFCQRKA